MFDFYRELYKKEEEAFYSAFIHKHKLFRDSGEAVEVSHEEYMKMQMMMKGMENATPHKRLEAKNAE